MRIYNLQYRLSKTRSVRYLLYEVNQLCRKLKERKLVQGAIQWNTTCKIDQSQHAYQLRDIMKTFIVLSSSFPVSCHWCVSKECNLPHGELCNSTLQHYNSCSLMVNHTFRSAGNYCVNIGLMNDVSATNTSFMVKIPGKANNNFFLCQYTMFNLHAVPLSSPYPHPSPLSVFCQG